MVTVPPAVPSSWGHDVDVALQHDHVTSACSLEIPALHLHGAGSTPLAAGRMPAYSERNGRLRGSHAVGHFFTAGLSTCTLCGNFSIKQTRNSPHASLPKPYTITVCVHHHENRCTGARLLAP